jgi:hypothetical protein
MKECQRFGILFLILIMTGCGKKDQSDCSAMSTSCQVHQQCFFDSEEFDHGQNTVMFINREALSAFIYYRVVPVANPTDCITYPFNYLTVLGQDVDSRAQLVPVVAGTQIEVIVTKSAIQPPDKPLLCNPADPLIKPEIVIHYCGINGAHDAVAAKKVIKIFDIENDGYGSK